MSETPTADHTPAEERPAPPRPAAMPYLCVADTRAALDRYRKVFGATVVGAPIVMDDGRVGHAELALGDGVRYLADAFPEIGVTAPRPGEASVSLVLPVADVDEVWSRVMAAGATGVREPADARQPQRPAGRPVRPPLGPGGAVPRLTPVHQSAPRRRRVTARRKVWKRFQPGLDTGRPRASLRS